MGPKQVHKGSIRGPQGVYKGSTRRYRKWHRDRVSYIETIPEFAVRVSVMHILFVCVFTGGLPLLLFAYTDFRDQPLKDLVQSFTGHKISYCLLHQWVQCSIHFEERLIVKSIGVNAQNTAGTIPPLIPTNNMNRSSPFGIETVWLFCVIIKLFEKVSNIHESQAYRSSSPIDHSASIVPILPTLPALVALKERFRCLTLVSIFFRFRYFLLSTENWGVPCFFNLPLEVYTSRSWSGQYLWNSTIRGTLIKGP